MGRTKFGEGTANSRVLDLVPRVSTWLEVLTTASAANALAAQRSGPGSHSDRQAPRTKQSRQSECTAFCDRDTGNPTRQRECRRQSGRCRQAAHHATTMAALRVGIGIERRIRRRMHRDINMQTAKPVPYRNPTYRKFCTGDFPASASRAEPRPTPVD